MEIEIPHPTLEDYQRRLNRMAEKYQEESWITLAPEKMTREDRFEYSFIVSAVGEQLIELECADIFQPSSHQYQYAGISNEPGIFPGSSIFAGVKIECPPVREAY